MKPATPLIATMLLTAVVETARGGDWPRFMGKDGTGVVEQGEKIARAWPGGGPKQLWSIDVGYGFGGAAIVGDKVYLLDRQRNDRDVFRVLNLKTGQTLWEQPYQTGGFRGGYSGSRGTPTIEGDRAYTVGVLGHVTCFDLKTKRIAWSKSLAKDFGARSGDWGFAQSPLIVGDLVVLSAAGGRSGVVALNKNTGNTAWTTRAFGETDTYTSPLRVTIDRQDQVVVWHKEVIAAFEPKNGNPLWAYDWRTNRPIPQPVYLGDGKFFLTTGYGAGCAMIQVNKAGRGGAWGVKEIFQDERSGSKVPPALFYDKHLYVNSDDNQRGLQCLTAEGDIRWETGRRASFGLGSMIIADGVIFIVDGDSGELVMAEANPRQYKELGRARLLDGGDLFAPLALSNGNLVLRDTKQMKCVYVGDGAPDNTRADAD
jgi:outer membrane protein assembly factor BamB